MPSMLGAASLTGAVVLMATALQYGAGEDMSLYAGDDSIVRHVMVAHRAAGA